MVCKYLVGFIHPRASTGYSVLRPHRVDFNRRWNISSAPDSPEEAFKKFKQRVITVFQNISHIYYDNDGYENKLQTTVDHIVTEESIFNFYQNHCIDQKYDYNIDQKTTIINRLKNENNEEEFYRLIEIILFLDISDFEDSSYINYGCILVNKNEIKNTLIKKIKEAIEISDVNVTITENPQGDILLYPKGEKKLDDTLVNQTLTFLNPKSNKHFEEALKLYQKNNPIKSAESLRRCLEEFLRHKLENKKGLEQNIKTLQTNIKGKSDPEVRNIIFQTFNYLDKYFNENSKHKDGNIDEPENEFLIYQTGLLMRYINASLGNKPK